MLGLRCLLAATDGGAAGEQTASPLTSWRLKVTTGTGDCVSTFTVMLPRGTARMPSETRGSDFLLGPRVPVTASPAPGHGGPEVFSPARSSRFCCARASLRLCSWRSAAAHWDSWLLTASCSPATCCCSHCHRGTAPGGEKGGRAVRRLLAGSVS